MSRIGLLGGTFDPPHLGHLLLAESAREQLKLDKVLFMPAGQPPHKKGRAITAVAHRVAMTRLAIAGHSSFQLDTTDADRPPPHFTASLLPLIRQIYAGARLWLLLGSDSLHDLPTWRHPEQIIQQCRLAVLPRPGIVVDWVRLSLAVPGVDAVSDSLDGPVMAVSSTQIRRWAAAGRSLRYITPAAVVNYIARERLYQA